MREFFYKELAKPILRRLGTIAATSLVAWGLPQDVVQQAITGLTALLLVVIEFVATREGRK